MKKLFVLLAIAFLAIACEGPTGPMGPPGYDGRPGQDGQDGQDGGNVGWLVFDVPISSNKWEYKGDYYSYTEYDSRITNTIYNDGITMAYIEVDGKFQTPLPYTRFSIVDGVQISELLDYEVFEGGITFFNTYSDFYTGDRPESAVIRVVCIW